MIGMCKIERKLYFEIRKSLLPRYLNRLKKRSNEQNCFFPCLNAVRTWSVVGRLFATEQSSSDASSSQAAWWQARVCSFGRWFPFHDWWTRRHRKMRRSPWRRIWENVWAQSVSSFNGKSFAVLGAHPASLTGAGCRTWWSNNRKVRIF